ncbi:MAG TPA: hypothetical protein VK929_14245 [Longimicrobiales bacterium]|nr:hypothetical protein [Longimicrobiales bacterium]
MRNELNLTCEQPTRRSPGDVALRLIQLFLGLLGWGLGIALFIRSHLGLGPWDAFHYGLHVQAGITVGVASIVAGFLILVVNTAMGIRPGLATVLNMIFIGVFTDLLLPIVPDATSLAAGFGYFAIAVPLVGLASGAYIGAGFGHGPRDGLMMALTIRTGWSVRRIRTLIELSVLAIGWTMGGVVGIGTIIITLTIGHSVQWGLRVFDAAPPARVQPIPRRRRRRLRRAA